MLSAVRAGQSVVFSSWLLDTGRSGSWAANPSLRDTVAAALAVRLECCTCLLP